MTRSLNSAKVLSLEFKEFKTRISDSSYKGLDRYRRILAKADDETAQKKLKLVEKLMRAMIKSGDATLRRRVPGSGTRKEVERQYNDSARNRALDRVGKKYTTIVYEDPEYVEVQAKMRRRKRKREEGEERPRNIWIEAVTQARKQLKVEGFVCVRKEPKDPDSKADVLGAKVYARACEIKKDLQAAKDAAKAEATAETTEQ